MQENGAYSMPRRARSISSWSTVPIGVPYQRPTTVSRTSACSVESSGRPRSPRCLFTTRVISPAGLIVFIPPLSLRWPRCTTNWEHRYRRLLGAEVVCPKPKVSVVLDGEPSGASKIYQPRAGTDNDVVDHGVRRCDFAVAVMPCELRQFEDVEGGVRVFTEERLDGGSTLSAPISSARAHGHDGILP